MRNYENKHHVNHAHPSEGEDIPPLTSADAHRLHIHIVRPAHVTEDSHEIESHHNMPIQSEDTSGSEADVDEPRPAAPARRHKPKSGESAPCVPCTPGKRYWIMDTGCPDDSISRKTMPPDCKPHIETADIALAYDTANGALKVDQTVDMQIESIGVASPYVLPTTADVLNVGTRCEKEGSSIGIHSQRNRT